eukprot:scaffold389_cov382-Prasinococcus_capsulatus_cf.AAC.25
MAPLYEQLYSKFGDQLNFGVVNIDDQKGMQLARDQNVLSEGIPYIQLFGDTSDHGSAFFSGWEVPSFAELESKLTRALSQFEAKTNQGKALKRPS